MDRGSGAPGVDPGDGGPLRARSGPSARPLLLTMLGEFAYPRDGRAWTGTIVEGLGALGVEQKAARQALSRTAHEGLLESTRHGRRVRWQLTASAAELLGSGADRIYGFLRSPRQWDGRWLIVSLTIPTSERLLRHRVRTRLSWLGMGSPSPGLWVVPDAHRHEQVLAVLDELGISGRGFAWVGPSVGSGDVASLIDSAWDLAGLERLYRRFVEQYRALDAADGREAFVRTVELIGQWRRFPFLDPDLPPELLPRDWPGAEAAATFHDRRDRWHRRAQEEWERLEELAGSRL